MDNDNEIGDIVYVLMNEAMQGYVKIGRTMNLEQRIRSLDNTSTPLPFECFYAARVKDAKFVERQLHDVFADNRIRSNREFFEISPERVVSALKLAELEDVTPGQDYLETEEDKVALEKARKIRSMFNFTMVQINPDTTLTFIRDENITCKVVDNRNVEFEGNVITLTAAAKIVLERQGINWKAVSGPASWQYEGETLYDLRKRMELEG